MTSTAPQEMPKPARLNALTGLRSFAALNILFFHFSNPETFNFHFYIPTPFSPKPYTFQVLLAPVVNAGYVSVSYFILLSGFVLGYNYLGRARAGQLEAGRFYKARFTRLYPIYFLSLLLAWWIGAYGTAYVLVLGRMRWRPFLMRGSWLGISIWRGLWIFLRFWMLIGCLMLL